LKERFSLGLPSKELCYSAEIGKFQSPPMTKVFWKGVRGKTSFSKEVCPRQVAFQKQGEIGERKAGEI